jgi:hypothetical protein
MSFRSETPCYEPQNSLVCPTKRLIAILYLMVPEKKPAFGMHY